MTLNNNKKLYTLELCLLKFPQEGYLCALDTGVTFLTIWVYFPLKPTGTMELIKLHY